MKRFLVLNSLLCFLFCASGPVLGQTVDSNYVDGSVFLKVLDTSQIDLEPYNNSIPALNLILSQFGVDSLYNPFPSNLGLDKIYRMEFSQINQVGALVSALSALPFIEYAEPAPLYKVSYTPNDYQRNDQWYLNKINAESAWDISRGSGNIKIAIVDNAVLRSHEDLNANIWVNSAEIPNNFLDDDLNGYRDDVRGWDAADADNDPDPPASTTNQDIFVHGTHCAGIASASTDNNLGIAALGFNCSIIPIKASPTATNGQALTHSYEGVAYAISVEADIISMSFGSKATSLTGQLVLQRATQDGIVLIAATGNSNTSDLFYPAAYPEVIGVGATNQADERAGFSNYGSYVDVMAPGVNILAPLAGNDTSYGFLSGTSMACPLVAGLAGLVLALDPALTPAQVEQRLEAGCVNIDSLNPNYIGDLGAGRIDARKTLDLVTGIVDRSGQPVAPLFAFPNPSSGTVYVQDAVPGALQVISLQGKVVGDFIVRNTEKLQLDLHYLEPGLYLLKNGQRIQKILISRDRY